MKHAHVQIEYDTTESLIGFNPTDKEDRQLVHDMLDEYLDRLAREYTKEGDDLEIPGNGFTVFNNIHTH
jgi:hypothetical protein